MVKDFSFLDYSALLFEWFPIMEMKGVDDVVMPSIWESSSLNYGKIFVFINGPLSIPVQVYAACQLQKFESEF